jgi:hypothetical protein
VAVSARQDSQWPLVAHYTDAGKPCHSKDGKGRVARATPVLPERARSECARSTAAGGVALRTLPMGWKRKDKETIRAVEGSLGHSPLSRAISSRTALVERAQSRITQAALLRASKKLLRPRWMACLSILTRARGLQNTY